MERLGSLRRQEAELSSHLGDYGVVMAIDRVTNGEWMPRTMRFKYAQYFTAWIILAISQDWLTPTRKAPAYRYCSSGYGVCSGAGK